MFAALGGQLLGRASFGADGEDLEIAPHRAFIGNPVSFRRPGGRGVVISFIGQPPHVSPVTVHDIDLG